MTTATEERLGSLRRRIDRLELKAQIGAADARSRMQHHVDELRGEQQEASVSIHHHAGAAEEKLEQLGTEVEITEHHLAAELAEDRKSFTDAVEAELQGWDAYLGRLQTKAAGKTTAARAHAEGAIADLRRRRIAVEESLTSVRSATGDAWRGAKSTVLAALDELKQRANALRSD